MCDPGHVTLLTMTPSILSGGLPAAILERIFGRPAAQWTIDDIIGLVEERGIRLISLMHVGGDGWLKTLDFVPRTVEHLRDIIEGGERCDGSSVFAGKGHQKRRFGYPFATPDRNGFSGSFHPLSHLGVLVWSRRPRWTSLPASPDTIIRRAYARANGSGSRSVGFGGSGVLPWQTQKRGRHLRPRRSRVSRHLARVRGKACAGKRWCCWPGSACP